MYPDYLSLSSDYGTVSKLFREHGVITSPMGCRAYLSPWHDEKGRYVAIGRCNIGAVSLNIPSSSAWCSSNILTIGAPLSGPNSMSVWK